MKKKSKELEKLLREEQELIEKLKNAWYEYQAEEAEASWQYEFLGKVPR